MVGSAGTTGCGWSSGRSSWSTDVAGRVHDCAEGQLLGLADLPFQGTAAFQGRLRGGCSLHGH